jgi:multidrug efflux pump subunit AcrA (membrane-fusion protein)
VLLTNRSRISRFLIIGIAGVAALMAIGWVALLVTQPSVVVTQVVQAPVVEAFYSTGTVAPYHEFNIRSSVAGIVKVLVDKGDHVKANQPVAIVVAPERQFNLDKAKAELRATEQMADPQSSPALIELRAKATAADEQLKLAQREEQRLQDAVAKTAASQTDLDKASDRVQSARSAAESFKAEVAAKKIELDMQVEVAHAAVAQAQSQFDLQTVVSPVSGVVLDRPVSSGTRLAENDHILQLADVSNSNLVMRAQVDEEDKNKLRPPVEGAQLPDMQEVRVALYSFPDHLPFVGRVLRVYDKADPDRRTYEVDVKLEDESIPLAAGMTGELAFIVSRKDKATVVPSQAVQSGHVWIVRNGKLVMSDAVIGLRSIERTEVVSGIDPQDQVLISPVHGLEAGQRVRTETMDPVTAAGLNRPKDTVTAAPFKG